MRFKDVEFSLVLESIDDLCSGGWVRAKIFHRDTLVTGFIKMVNLSEMCEYNQIISSITTPELVEPHLKTTKQQNEYVYFQ